MNDLDCLADQFVPTPGLSASVLEQKPANHVASLDSGSRQDSISAAMFNAKMAMLRLWQLQAACPADFRQAYFETEWDLLKDRVAKLDERIKADG